MTTSETDEFATFVATLGRGPGRSRALTRAEACRAMTLMLDGAADPLQIGAFLVLLRYRGEDPEEITGLVEGARTRMTLEGVPARLDWPSYGAGRTRGAPWFLLAALALGQAGIPVLMHGTNEFSGGMTVADALARLGLPSCTGADDAASSLRTRGFAYIPAEALDARFAALLGLRRLLGLRSPLNTVARLINPANAQAGVDGVFHPPYIETHLAVAERTKRGRLLVLKGGGGEAERNPAKPVQVHLWDGRAGTRTELTLPSLQGGAAAGPEPDIGSVWNGSIQSDAITARIIATIALGLLAIGEGDDAQARQIWQERRPGL